MLSRSKRKGALIAPLLQPRVKCFPDGKRLLALLLLAVRHEPFVQIRRQGHGELDVFVWVRRPEARATTVGFSLVHAHHLISIVTYHVNAELKRGGVEMAKKPVNTGVFGTLIFGGHFKSGTISPRIGIAPVRGLFIFGNTPA